MRLRTSILSALALAAAAGVADAQDVVRLKSGRHLCGTITIDESNRDGFTVALWDTGGTVFVSWAQLPAGEVSRLRSKPVAPVTSATVGDILDGVRIITASREVIGVLTSETDDVVFVKTAAGTSPAAVPKGAILKRENLKIRETEAYLPEEMIEKRAQGDLTPDRLVELGNFARALRRYAKAREFYTSAAAAAPERQEEMDPLIAEIDGILREEAAAKALAEIRRLQEETKYPEAIEAAGKFLSDFGETQLGRQNADLTKKLEAERQEFVANRDKILARRVPEIWRSLRNSLWGKYTDRRYGLREARASVDRMDQEIIKGVTAKIGCTPEEAQKFWDMREMKPTTVSMGAGSWIYKGGQDGGDDWTPEAKQNDPVDDFARRFGPPRGRAQDAPPPKGHKLQKSEDWWVEASGITRLKWLQCYYGITSGTVKKREEEKPCNYCRGKGVVTAVRGAEETDVICPRCHGAKVDVWVTFQ